MQDDVCSLQEFSGQWKNVIAIYQVTKYISEKSKSDLKGSEGLLVKSCAEHLAIFLGSLNRETFVWLELF